MTSPASPRPGTLDEAGVRRVLLLQAFETGAADTPQWTAEDRSWATRLARDSVAATAAPVRFLDERARHAMQRLAPRDTGVQRALQHRGWRWVWLPLALLAGLMAGVAVDAIGSAQRINLLAPPVWGVVLWNLLVYALMLPLPGLAVFGVAKRWLVQRLAAWSAPGSGGSGSAAPSPMQRFHALWLREGAPLLRPRAAMLLHGAAAALALGLVAGLYVRGLVLDYRAGWQSTFLDAEQVRAVLATGLKPASLFTGVPVPDVNALQALRFGPEGTASLQPLPSAAPWIHLYAATLLLFVVLPRSVLAGLAAARALLREKRLSLPLEEPYFQRLLREQQGSTARVQVLPHGAAPTPHALACLQAALAPVLGSGVQISSAVATAYGDEERATTLTAPTGTTLRLLLVDLGATPESDTHGTFARALRQAAPAVPLLVLADETAFRLRFASLPTRLAERRAAWQQWAQAEGLGCVIVDLAQPDAAATERALHTALQSTLAAGAYA